MSRRKRTYKSEVSSDKKYKEVVVSKLINKCMVGGKKSVAQKLIYRAIEHLDEKKLQDSGLEVLKKAVENCKPVIEVRSRRVGGATYQVPVDVRPSRRLSLALRWLIDFARGRGEKDFSLRIAGELLDAYQNKGNSIKKKEEVHRMAESNRAFAHLNW